MARLSQEALIAEAPGRSPEADRSTQHGNGSGRCCPRTGAEGAPETRRPFVPPVGHGEDRADAAFDSAALADLSPPCIAKGGCSPFKNQGYPRIVLRG
jgi:hypothetical protein